MIKNIVLSFVFLFSILASGQTVNDYKYALVPAKFSLFKTDDYYRLNVLTKMYMEKSGFITYFDTDIQSEEFKGDMCNKVFVDITHDKGFFLTKVKVILKDCRGQILATSEEGKSREKSYVTAYYEALRDALDNFPELKKYKYNSKGQAVVEPAVTKDRATASSTTTNSSKATNGDIIELFAKPFQNGYQLLTNTTAIPNLILTVSKTSSPDCYFAERNTIQGVFIRKTDGWYFDYYKDGKLVSERYTVVNF